MNTETFTAIEIDPQGRTWAVLTTSKPFGVYVSLESFVGHFATIEEAEVSAARCGGSIRHEQPLRCLRSAA